jgi:2-polyprenyl-6-methoxyphenol hydroxylase-like FAD-dependent oxidoreductase
MPSDKRALVIGGSLGGLFVARFLRHAGWRVTIFERSREGLASRGAGLGTTRELAEALRRAGAHFDVSVAVPMNGYVWLDRGGRVVYEEERYGAGSTWSRVYLPLRSGLPEEMYRASMGLTRVEQDGATVTAIFSDGTRATGDLLIAADGNQSTVRRQYMPEVEPRYAGYVAWRGMMEERDIPPALHRDFFDKVTFSFPEGEMALAMPVPGRGDGTRPGHRGYYFIWYHPTTWERVKELCTDVSGFNHGISIPPPLIRPEFVRDIRERAEALFAPYLAAVIRRTPPPFLQPVTDLEAPQMVVGRVALLGDSAFVARPHVAAGATKAALDAACLVDTLVEEDDIDAALARYQRAQLEFGRKLVAHGRYLGAYLEAQLKPEAERAEGEGTRDPVRLMRDYGAPHLVHNLEVQDLAALAQLD